VDDSAVAAFDYERECIRYSMEISTRKFDRKPQVFWLGMPSRLEYRAKPTSMERFIWESVQRRPSPCGSTWDFESTVADRPGWDPQPLCPCRFARQQSPLALNKL